MQDRPADCGETILLITAPDELVAAMSTGLSLNCLAPTTCRLPKRYDAASALK